MQQGHICVCNKELIILKIPIPAIGLMLMVKTPTIASMKMTRKCLDRFATTKGSFLQVFSVKNSGVLVLSSFIRLSFVVHCLFTKCLHPFIHRLRECFFSEESVQ